MFHKFCLLLLLAVYVLLWMSCWWWWDWWDNTESSWLSYFCSWKINTSSSIFFRQALISSLKNKETMSKLWKWYKSPNLFGALSNNNKKKCINFTFHRTLFLTLHMHLLWLHDPLCASIRVIQKLMPPIFSTFYYALYFIYTWISNYIK